MLYLQLFWEFFKTGLFAIGGGMATLPFLYDMADKTGWFTRAQLADMIAVSESTPGPLGVNMATYVTALITAAGLVVVRETFWLTGGVLFWQGTVLAAVLLVLTRWVKQTKNWHPIVFIGLSALVGVVFRFAGA